MRYFERMRGFSEDSARPWEAESLRVSFGHWDYKTESGVQPVKWPDGWPEPQPLEKGGGSASAITVFVPVENEKRLKELHNEMMSGRPLLMGGELWEFGYGPYLPGVAEWVSLAPYRGVP